ncbi:MAG: DUF362 domain-containing protein [Bryobacterales bacterium]|nr:DUF362 domain-containing protein [Bryobacterales bacterium]
MALQKCPAYSRREILASFAAAPALAWGAGKLPVAPVAIARCGSYAEDQAALLRGLFDKIGGLGALVKNKTVTVKLNLTGSPALRLQGKPLGSTHYSHPAQIGAFVRLLGEAGARRVRLVESGYGTAGPLDEYMLDSGWNVRAIKNAAPQVELINTNGLTVKGRYARRRVPGKPFVFPSYMLHPAYEETDVVVSMAKLKDHATCGVTLAMKNMFGITPASIYGDDAGHDDPNESPTKGRVETCHLGKRQPARIAESEIDPRSSREPGYRMPRITAELVSARPIDISIIDGIETMAGGEGPWIRDHWRGALRAVKPGIMVVGTNPVSTDTVATALMGYDPRAPKGQGAFRECDNTLLLAEQMGVGAADLKQIEVRGGRIEELMFRFTA